MHAYISLPAVLLQESQALGLPFEGVDLAAPLQRLHVGDEVEFRVALDRRTGQLKATEVCD